MKKYKHILDIALLIGLGVVAFLAVAPKSVVMPSSLEMILLAVVLGMLATFLVLFWRENPSDERELQHQAEASRSAYIVGSGVLIVTLFIQGLNHTLDPAVPLALLAMIATKVLVQIFKD